MELEQAGGPVLLAVSVWEITRKTRLDKLSLPYNFLKVCDVILNVCRHHQIEILVVDGEICHRAELPDPHDEDPFDRSILVLGAKWHAPVFTNDRRFENYPVRVIGQW